MTDYPALDVALGLAFLYFLLAVIASAANEGIQTFFGVRAKYLERWFLNVLEGGPAAGEVQTLYDNALVKPLLCQPKGLLGRAKAGKPSYISSDTFSAAVVGVTTHARTAEELIAAIPYPRVKEVATQLQRAGDDAAQLQARIERWYDDSMERVSGWYKRRVQLWIFVIGLVLVVVTNADTVGVAGALWKEKPVRTAVAAAVASTPGGTTAKDAADKVGALSQIGLPLGWGDSRFRPDTWQGGISKLVGLLLTTLAIMLGAPFWFDLVSKVARLRGTGAPPPTSGGIRTGEGEQRRVGPAPPSDGGGSDASAAPEKPGPEPPPGVAAGAIPDSPPAAG